MRILRGQYAGRQLTSPGGKVRPTPEEVRDACLTLVAGELPGARVLDLFAGSGAVGLEALSRGAKSADFVDNGPAALHSLKANVAALRTTKWSRIFKHDVIPWIAALEAGAYRIAYVDPPYGSKKLDRVVERWAEVPFADILILEHEKGHEIGAAGEHYDFDGPTRITVLRAPIPLEGLAYGRTD
jgi:16S rRNA (guanine966-N2)-methyltransferase